MSTLISNYLQAPRKIKPVTKHIICLLTLLGLFESFESLANVVSLKFVNHTVPTYTISALSGSSCWTPSPNIGAKLQGYGTYPITGSLLYTIKPNCDTKTSIPITLINANNDVATIIITQEGDKWKQENTKSANKFSAHTAFIIGDTTIVNIYVDSNFTFPDPSSWMGDPVYDNSSLKTLTLIGAHDAAMSKADDCTDFGGPCNTKTQTANFYELLSMGVREFDIRPVIRKENIISLGHYSYVEKIIDNQGCSGEKLDSLFTQINRFLKQPKSNKEVILIELSHYMDLVKENNDSSTFDSVTMVRLIQSVTRNLNAYLYKNDINYFSTNIRAITQNGPKVIVLADTGYKGKFTFDGSAGIYQTPHSLFNVYSHTNKVQSMVSNQLGKLDDHALSTYFFLSWTLTQDFDQQTGCLKDGKNTILDLATQANAAIDIIPDYCNSKREFPNILYGDAISSDYYRIAMYLNRLRKRQQ